jgi:hypothetical protein
MTETISHWDKPFFAKFFLRSLFLNVCWTFIGTQIGRLLPKDTGNLLIGLGFLIIYSVTFFYSFDKAKRTKHTFLMLTLAFFSIFLAATFIVPMFFVNAETNFSVYLFLFFSTLVAIISIVLIVGHYTFIKNKWLTIGIATTAAFLGTSIFFAITTSEHFDILSINNILNPLAIGFCVWQILTAGIIGQSLAYR